MCGEEFYRGQIAALWTQTLIFGFYVALFAGSICVLSRTKTDNTYYLGTSVAMFALCAALLILNFVQVLMTPDFVVGSQCVGSICSSCNSGQGISDRVNEEIIQTFFNFLVDLVFAVNQFVADSLLIYRCYVIWEGKKWIAVTLRSFYSRILVRGICCTLMNSGLGIEGVTFAQAYCDITLYYIRSTTSASEQTPPAKFLEISALDENLSLATIPLSLATNIIATALIAGRIWWMARKVEGTLGAAAGRKYRSAVIMIVESGAIWSTSIVIWLITYFMAPNYHSIPGFAMQQLMGIAPTFIIVRVGLGQSVEATGLGSQGTRSADPLSSVEAKPKWAKTW